MSNEILKIHCTIFLCTQLCEELNFKLKQKTKNKNSVNNYDHEDYQKISNTQSSKDDS